MTSESYKQAYRQAMADLIKAIKERDRLNLEIIKLQQLVKSLAYMSVENAQMESGYKAGFEAMEETLGFTETVHTMVRAASQPVTAVDIKNRLHVLGYDLAKYSNPLGFIHTVLGRLVKQGKIVETSSGAYVNQDGLYQALALLAVNNAFKKSDDDIEDAISAPLKKKVR